MMKKNLTTYQIVDLPPARADTRNFRYLVGAMIPFRFQ